MYEITEPHPSYPPTSYIHTGRGGSGNTFATPSAHSLVSKSRSLSRQYTNLSSQSTTTNTRFAGRGGAGNARGSTPEIDYDEILSKRVEDEHTRRNETGGYAGRGGMGNYSGSRKSVSSDRKTSEGSVSSGDSRRRSFLRRLSQSIF